MEQEYENEQVDLDESINDEESNSINSNQNGLNNKSIFSNSIKNAKANSIKKYKTNKEDKNSANKNSNFNKNNTRGLNKDKKSEESKNKANNLENEQAKKSLDTNAKNKKNKDKVKNKDKKNNAKKNTKKLIENSSKTKEKSKTIMFIMKNKWVIIALCGIILLLIIIIIILLLVGSSNSRNSANYSSANGFQCDVLKPIEEYKVTRTFSWYIDGNIAYANKGILLEVAENDSIVNSFSGNVESITGQEGDYTVIIQTKLVEYDNLTYKILYSNLKTINEEKVIVGNKVYQGEILGTTNEENLYYEIQRNNIQVSPNKMFGYDDPSDQCNPVKSPNLTVEEITNNGCNEMKKLETDFEEYCSLLSSFEYVWPHPSCNNITSEFGYRTHPITGKYTFHGAIDISCFSIPGASIVATSSGEVVVASYCTGSCNTGYGNYVKIKHDDGNSSIYAHLNEITVNKGDYVFAGDEIGKEGTTGSSTGYHLHFAIFSNGSASDPCLNLQCNE